MTKITAAVRATIRTIIDDSRDYDVSTLVISRDGSVSAKKDADKTYAGYDSVRYLVGHVQEMVDANGNRREGW